MDRNESQSASNEVFVLPSRRAALDACRAALGAEAGPVLVTGEPGAGKTWLAQRLAVESQDEVNWVHVDLTPTTSPVELFRTIGHALGLAGEGQRDTLRLALADSLAELHADGRRWVLVVDEAHLASANILEEVRVLSNRLGRPDGFASLVLLGQTSLACRVGTRPLAALEARLAARVHLRPIDADEAWDLLSRLRPERASNLPLVEHWHRLAGGNPRRLLRLASTESIKPALVRTSSQPLPASPPLTHEPIASSPLPAPTDNPPRLGPARPPIRFEDGLIEVGWESELDSEVQPVSVTASTPTPELAAEESINDHYAALQAWNEWAVNQGREPAQPANQAKVRTDSPHVSDSDHSNPLDSHPQIWAEGQQSFAPYSQLFSRMRQSHDPD
ncbi:MAG: AAA family ATPase [Isosphaeraceae bacterium]